MRTAKDIINHQYRCLSNEKTLERQFNHIYATDLLSQAIKSAKDYAILITLISHDNSVAVAMMIDLPIIIITENKTISKSMIEKCNEENICLISTELMTHEVVVDLYRRGLYEILL